MQIFKLKKYFEIPVKSCNSEYNFYPLLTKLLLVFLLFQIGFVVFNNFKYGGYYLHADAINEISSKIKVAETGNLLPPDWIHSNELSLNRLPFVFAFFYHVSGGTIMVAENLYLAAMLLFQMGALYYLLSRLHFHPIAKILTIILYVGFNQNLSTILYQYFSGLGGIAIAIFLSYALILHLQSSISKSGKVLTKTNIVLFICSLTLTIYFGFGSPKIILFLWLPLLLSKVYFYIREYGLAQKVQINTNFFIICYILFLMAINAGIYIISTVLYIEQFHPVSPVIFAPLSQQVSPTNISLRIQELLTGLGILSPAPLTSLPGILYGLSIIFAIITIISFFILKVDKRNLVNQEISFFWIFTLIISLTYMLVTAPNVIVSRYVFVINIFSIILIGALLSKVAKKKSWLISFASITIIIAVCVNDVQNNRTNNVYENSANSSNGMNFCVDYIQKNGYSNIVAQYWVAGQVTFYSNWELNVLHYSDIKHLFPFFWMTDRSLYSQEQMNQPTLLLITDDEEAKILNGDNHYPLNLGEKVFEAEIYNLYAFDAAPLPYSLFPQGINAPPRTYNFRQWPVTLLHNSLIENTSIRAGGSQANAGFFGPYIKVPDGVYTISIHYKVIESESDIVANADIANNTIPFVQRVLRANETICTFENVTFKDINLLELRAFTTESSIVEFTGITITNVSPPDNVELIKNLSVSNESMKQDMGLMLLPNEAVYGPYI